MRDRRRRTAQCAAVPVLLACLACGSDDAAQSRPSESSNATPLVVPAVEVVEARSGVLPLSERTTGTVRATGEVAIYPQTSGSVAEVLVQNGSRVQRGDPLVRILSAGSAAQVQQARSGLEVSRAAEREAVALVAQLEAQYERYARLGKDGLVPADTVATLRSQLQAARAAQARARAEIALSRATVTERADVQAQLVVRAPIAGRVGQRNVEVGMRVDPQTPLFVIGQLDTVRVEVPVAQDLVTTLEPGQRVEIEVPGRDEPIEAAVSRISPFLDDASYTAEVEIDVANPDGVLVPGMFVSVDVFHGETAPTTLLPVSALFTDASSGQTGVYVAPAPAEGKGGSAPERTTVEPIDVAFRTVRVVGEGQGLAGVDGVEPGEWVVVVGQHLLAEQATTGTPRARPRQIAWSRVLELQRLQRDDLLRSFMERQQRLGLGSEREGA